MQNKLAKTSLIIKQLILTKDELNIKTAVDMMWRMSEYDSEQFKQNVIEILNSTKTIDKSAVKNPILISSILKTNPEMLYDLSEITQTNTEKILNYLIEKTENTINKIGKASATIKNVFENIEEKINNGAEAFERFSELVFGVDPNKEKEQIKEIRKKYEENNHDKNVLIITNEDNLYEKIKEFLEEISKKTPQLPEQTTPILRV